MAFDLNKNEPAVKAKIPFNLSKGETVAENPKNSNWIIALILVVLVGGTIWYLLSPSTAKVAESNTAAKNPAKAAATIEKSSGKTTVAGSHSDSAGLIVNPKDLNIIAPKSVKPTEESISGTFFNNKVAATFAQGSAAFAGRNTMLINKLVKYLAANPNASININGYASSEGTLAANELISQNRADTFRKYLVANNIDENRIVAMGKGIENPIASNETDAGRRKNRRVEITLN